MKMKLAAAAFAMTMSFGSGAFAANIVQTAASTGQFNTLLAAAKAAGLAGALSHTKDITVFAPTDEAFAKLPEGTVEELLLPKNRKKLADILKYHVVPSKVTAADVPRKSTEVGTLKAGGDTTIKVRKRFGRVRVDNARVVTADVEASNGVIHIINKVLLPSD